MEFLKRSILWLPVGYAFTDVVASVHRIKGDSMAPTLNPEGTDSDVVLVEKISVRLFKYNRGDVVLLKSPTEPKKLLVKRLIGIEGDWVSPPDGNGKMVKIPQGRCWIEGDNLRHSEDSRNTFGPVPLALIEGRAVRICWPLHRYGPLPPSPILINSRVAFANTNNETDWF